LARANNLKRGRIINIKKNIFDECPKCGTYGKTKHYDKIGGCCGSKHCVEFLCCGSIITRKKKDELWSNKCSCGKVFKVKNIPIAISKIQERADKRIPCHHAL
jgi:hypothetical protein